MNSVGTSTILGRQEVIPPLQERRRRVRHKIHTPAYASLDESTSGMVLDLSEILDISEDGMSIQTASSLVVNQRLNLCLDLSETKTYINTAGRVVWRDASGRAGIEFPEMAPQSVLQLKRWLFVNALMACMNASALPGAGLPELSSVEGTNAPASLPADFVSEVVPDHSTVLTALNAIRREVEALGADLDVALQLVVERALSISRATGAAIALLDEEAMVCRASAGSDAPDIGVRLQIGSGFSAECVRTGRLLRCDDSENDSRVDRESCRALGIRSMIAIPLRSGERVIGLLELFSPSAGAFHDRDNDVMRSLAETSLGAVKRAAKAGRTKVLQPQLAAVESAAELPISQPAEAGFNGRTALLFAAAITVIGAVLWFLVPRPSRPAPSNPQPTPSVTSQPVNQETPAAADVSDFAGLLRLAEQGDPAAQFAVGARYATGEDIKQNYPEAVRWFEKAAQQGHVVAQATLGAYYWAGRGVPQDLRKAYFWSILAQAGGDEASKYRVAVLASRMTRAEVIIEQQNANAWLKQHQVESKN